MDNAMGDQDSSDEEQVRLEKLHAVIFYDCNLSKALLNRVAIFYQPLIGGLILNLSWEKQNL